MDLRDHRKPKVLLIKKAQKGSNIPLSVILKMNTLSLATLLCLTPLRGQCQLNIQWQKTFGGNLVETAYSIGLTTDGGYIAAGFALSINNGDVQGSHGGGDIWITKLNAVGELQWQKAFGGNSTELAYSIQQTSDGGYFFAGKTFSNNGDVSGSHGDLDYWAVKLDSLGSILWQRTLGGSGKDECNSAMQTTDGGFILAGNSASTDGDVTNPIGYHDYWIVKLNIEGEIEWQKSFGGSNGSDKAYSIRQTHDGGFIIAGETGSTNGDVSGNHGGSDYWIIKLGPTGNLEWQKALGGEGIDAARGVCQTDDDGFLVIGETGSGNTGQVSGVHGDFDVWLVKLSPSGEFEWQKAFGGSDSDYGRVIKQIENGNILFAGHSISSNGDVINNNGGLDVWVVILDEFGQILKQNTFGGSDQEYCFSIENTDENGFILAGSSSSNDGDPLGNDGGQDFWIVKLSPESSPTTTPPAQTLQLYPNPAQNTLSIKLSTTLTSNAALTLKITDLLGREVLQKSGLEGSLGSVDLDVSSLPGGMYLLQMSSLEGEIWVGKFQKLD